MNAAISLLLVVTNIKVFFVDLQVDKVIEKKWETKIEARDKIGEGVEEGEYNKGM